MNLFLLLLYLAFLFITVFENSLYFHPMKASFVFRRVLTSSVPSFAAKFSSSSRKTLTLLSIGGLVLSSLPSRADCAPTGKKSDDQGGKDKDKDHDFDFQKFIATELGENGSLNGVKKFFESGVPGQLGYGFVMGYSSGFCLKKVSRVFAFVLGGSFMLIQSLSYSGLIKVDYEGIQTKMEKVMDLNKDGKVDGDDLQFAQQKLIEVLGYNMPAGGGFAAGLMAGLRA